MALATEAAMADHRPDSLQLYLHLDEQSGCCLLERVSLPQACGGQRVETVLGGVVHCSWSPPTHSRELPVPWQQPEMPASIARLP